MALPRCDHVERGNRVPALLGLCQGLGPPPVQLQESVAEGRLSPSTQVRILLLVGSLALVSPSSIRSCRFTLHCDERFLKCAGAEPCAEASLAADSFSLQF